jgi:hypothetical protein
VYQNSAPQTLGSVTILTSLQTLTIPASALAVGDSMEIVYYASFANSGSPGTRTMRICKDNQSGTVMATTAGLVTTVFSTVLRVVGKVINSTTLLLSPVATTNATTSVTIDLTQPLVLAFCGQKAVSGDTYILQHCSVNVQKL